MVFVMASGKGKADPQHSTDHCEMCIYLDAELRAFVAETVFYLYVYIVGV